MILFFVNPLNIDRPTPNQTDSYSLNKIATNIYLNRLMTDNFVQNLDREQVVHLESDFTRTHISCHTQAVQGAL